MVVAEAAYPRSLTSDPPEELDLFSEFCFTVLRTENGRPMELYEGERVFLTPYFRGITESLILIPKKNGKSTLLAALALFHLCTTPDAECIVVASSRDQAGILLRQVQGFIRRSPWLRARLKVKQREIVCEELGGRIRILASDVDTADGVLPTLVLVDELHRHKSADLYGVLRDGLGPLDGQLIAISTAGEDTSSFLGEIRRRMLALPGVERIGCYSYSCDEVMAFHEFALPPDADRSDMRLVKMANPAPWQTIAKLRNRYQSASMKDWQWARFACGVWVAGEHSAYSAKEWGACAVPGVAIPRGASGVILGIDFGWRWDTTAMVPVWNPEGERLHVHRPAIITPPRDGTATDEMVIWEQFLEFREMWPDELTVVLDPNAGGEQFAQRVVREFDNIRVVEHSQMPRPMALAAQRLSRHISTELLAHPDDEELNAHILAAAAKPVGEGYRLVKMSDNGLPIDAAIALAMAVSVFVGEEDDDGDDEVATW